MEFVVVLLWEIVLLVGGFVRWSGNLYHQFESFVQLSISLRIC